MKYLSVRWSQPTTHNMILKRSILDGIIILSSNNLFSPEYIIALINTVSDKLSNGLTDLIMSGKINLAEIGEYTQ